MTAMNSRSPLSPNSDSTAPSAIASGCSVGTRKPSKPGFVRSSTSCPHSSE